MKQRYYFSLAIAILSQLVMAFCLPTMPAMAKGCDDIRVVFADGSGAKIGGTDNNFLDFKAAISAELNRTGLSFEVYELGSVGYGGYKYPAAEIGVLPGQLSTTIGAYVSGGEFYKYGESVNQGVGELKAYVNETLAKCPKTKFVLGGYSQGGGVISEAITQIDSKKIIYAATFGDAKLYLPEGAGEKPLACRGKNLSPYRDYVPDCRTYEGILKGRIPYQPGGYNGKLGAWCNYHDVICSSYINWANLADSIIPHASYGNSFHADRLFEKAAAKIYKKVLAEFGDKVQTKKKVTHNVAILIDATGSMQPLIEQYKQEALRLAKEVLDNDGAVALYEYRDLAADKFLPKLHCNFETCTLEKIREELGTIEAIGGVDAPESVLSAALTALEELKWKYGAMKSIVVLTDAGYHSSEVFGDRTITLKTVVDKSLEIDPVNFYTINPSEGVAGLYQDLVGQTSGKSFSVVNELSFSTDFILGRPDAKLAMENYFGEVGDEIYFDASDTEANAKIVKYMWDLDLDGVFEKETTVPFISKTYNSETEGFVQVKVIDENGMFGTMSAKVKIEAKSKDEKLAKIWNLQYSKLSQSELKINFETDAYRTLLVVNDVIAGVIEGKTVTIRDLDFGKENKVVLVSYGESGYAGERQEIVLKKAEDRTKSEMTVPKTPNCGSR